MENANHRGVILVAGAAGLCCGGHVLLSLGGLAVLTGWMAAWGWPVAGGVVLAGLGVGLYRLRAKGRIFRGTGGDSRSCAG